MNTTNSGKMILRVILVVSLAFNILLVIQYAGMAKQPNPLWSNAVTQLSQMVNWVSLNNGGMANGKTDVAYPWDDAKANLRLLEQQLENLSILPYADRIFSWKQREKLRLFIGYNREVFRLMEQEQKEKGAFSAENQQRIEIIHKTWEDILRVLETERNRRDPYQPIFSPGSWSGVFDSVMDVFDRVELMPLSTSS